jgi:outer membrane protein assembly factor BamE
MTRAQVRFVLGTPLVVDVFHADRWDYVYVYRKAGQVTEHRRMTVIFRDDKLARLEGDVVPAKSKPAVPETKPKPSPNAASLKPAESAPPRKSEADSGNSKSQAEKSKEEPQKDGAAAEEEKGFFGRMFEKLGF